MQHKLGIVLSGGGSRGLVHAGVLRALREAGIEPEIIAGTSSGAVVGALHAAGHDTTAIIDFFDHVSPFSLSRFALRKAGFFDTEKMVTAFGPYFPGDSFESLGKRLLVTATDLVHARLEVFSSGPLIRPIIASSSVPLVFTPTAIDGRLYSDGGVLDNFSVDLLVGRCEVILGVYASPLRQRAQIDLGSRLTVAHRAFELGMHFASQRRFHRCHHVLSPPELSTYLLFDVKRHREIADLGYRAAMDAMDEIRAVIDRDGGA